MEVICGMPVKNARAQAIDDYFETHPDDVIAGRMQPYELDGRREDLQVYRLPLNLLSYSIRNGRFAAELRELEATRGKHLDPERASDANEIENLLLKDTLKAAWLHDDIERVGQLTPGVITFDGAIIDGNRRVTVLHKLYAETGQKKYDFFEAVMLPSGVAKEDLWRIEAGIQLSADLKVSYGPINELLKIKE